MMGKLMIWAVPRSKSTFLCKAVASQSNVKCLFEPISIGFLTIKGNENRRIMEEIFRAINDQLQLYDHVVCKDIPAYLMSGWNIEDWINTDMSVKHVLLIRHPREVCLSTVELNGEPAPYMQYNVAVPVEKHFKALLNLKQFFEETGRPYMVVDSSNLNEALFEHTVEKLCEFGDIPFQVEKIRNMDTSEELPSNWWVPLGLDSNKLSNFFDSTQNYVVRCYDDALKLGKYGQTSSKVNKESLSEENERILKETLKLSMPIYEELKEYELK